MPQELSFKMSILAGLMALMVLSGCSYKYKPAPKAKQRLQTHLTSFQNDSTHGLTSRQNLTIALINYLRKSNQYTYGNAEKVLNASDGELIKLAKEIK